MLYIYNYLVLYIDNNVIRSGESFNTRAKNKQYALQKSCYSLIKMFNIKYSAKSTKRDQIATRCLNFTHALVKI